MNGRSEQPRAQRDGEMDHGLAPATGEPLIGALPGEGPKRREWLPGTLAVISSRLGSIPPLGQVPLRTPRLVLIVGDVVEQHESCTHGVLEVDDVQACRR